MSRISEALTKLEQFTPRIDSSKRMQELDVWLKENLPVILRECAITTGSAPIPTEDRRTPWVREEHQTETGDPEQRIAPRRLRR